jgi:hypothetical protein
MPGDTLPAYGDRGERKNTATVDRGRPPLPRRAIANLASISDLQLADLDDDALAELACMLSEVHGLSWSDEGSNRGVQAWTPSY